MNLLLSSSEDASPAQSKMTVEYSLSKLKEPGLPRHVRKFLGSAPCACEGLMHRWLYRAACVLRAARVAEDEIGPLMTCAIAGEGVSSREIQDAVVNSRNAGMVSRAPRWPVVSLAARQRIVLERGNLCDLQKSSPDDPGRCTPRRMLKRLFRSGELVCAGTGPTVFITRERDVWLESGLARETSLVPSPMCARHGQTRDGRMSARSLGNVGPRRWIIVEQDHGSLNEQAAIIQHLAGFLPLGLVVFSGGKSLHAWFATAGRAKTDMLRFFKHAVSLGADPSLWNASQMTRLPGARRNETGQLQRVHYVNFDTIKKAKWEGA